MFTQCADPSRLFGAVFALAVLIISDYAALNPLTPMCFIECLETRIAPALVTPIVVSKGVLLLKHDAASGTADNLTVTETAPSSFHVTDNMAGMDYGTFTGVKSINVQFGATNDSLTLEVSGDGLAGALTMNTGDGTNSINLNTTGSAGRIVGAVNIIGGSGADTVTPGDGIVIGGKVSFTGNDGADSITADNAYLTKRLSLDNVETITFGQSSPVVVGGMTVDNDEAATLITFILNDIVSIKGSLNYCGSDTQDDNVTINGQVSGLVKLMLEGGTNTVSIAGELGNALNISATGGNDSVTFTNHSTSVIPLIPGTTSVATIAKGVRIALGDGTNSLLMAEGSHFFNSVTLLAGAGSDTVNMGDFYIAKNLTLSLGDGTNVAQLDPFSGVGENTKHIVHGNLKFIGGIGNDTLGIDDLTAGGLIAKLGDGANGVTGFAPILGKKISITGGDGVDTLNVGFDSFNAAFSAKLGASDDPLTYTGGSLAKAVLDGGDGAGDTLSGLTLLPAVQKIKNFENES